MRASMKAQQRAHRSVRGENLLYCHLHHSEFKADIRGNGEMK